MSFSFGVKAHSQGVSHEYAFFITALDFGDSASSESREDNKKNAKKIYNEFLAPGAPREIVVRCATQLPLLCSRLFIFRPCSLSFASARCSQLILKDIENRLSNADASIFQKAMTEVGFILEPQCISYARQFNMDLDSVKQMAKINLRPIFSN